MSQEIFSKLQPSVGSLLGNATIAFMRNGFSSPAVEARALMAGILRVPETRVILQTDHTIDHELVMLFQSYVERRLRREPVAYILGKVNFMGADFRVNPSVLVPRPETELLVEDILMEVRDRQLREPRILDIGTGSGCIAISLALALPEAKISAIDLSQQALEIAKDNARKYGVSIEFILNDLLKDFPPENQDGFDMIVSNLPYIATPDLPGLEPELSFEPKMALDGGEDGLAVLKRLVPEAYSFLKPNGLLAMEIGHDQGDRLRDLLSKYWFGSISILKDYGGHDRIAKGNKRGPI